MFNFKYAIEALSNLDIRKYSDSVIDDFTNVKFGIPEFAHALTEQIRSGSVFSCRINKDCSNKLTVKFNRRIEKDTEFSYMNMIIDDYPAKKNEDDITGCSHFKTYKPSREELYEEIFEMELGHFIYDLIYYRPCGERVLVSTTTKSETDDVEPINPKKDDWEWAKERYKDPKILDKVFDLIGIKSVCRSVHKKWDTELNAEALKFDLKEYRNLDKALDIVVFGMDVPEVLSDGLYEACMCLMTELDTSKKRDAMKTTILISQFY